MSTNETTIRLGGQVLTIRQHWHPVTFDLTTVTHIAGAPEYLLDGGPVTADKARQFINAHLQP